MIRLAGITIGKNGFLVLSCLIFITSPLFSDNIIDIGHTTCEIIFPPFDPDDTIFVGTPVSLDIYIENDEILSGINLGFKVWSPDGATWTWDSAILDITPIPGTDPPEFDTTWSIATVVPGSRVYFWDNSGLDVNELNVDGTGDDTICISSAGIQDGLMPGPYQRQILLHLTTGGASMGEVKTICIDSVNQGTGCDFVFVDAASQSIIPTIGWPEEGKCFALKILPNCVFAQFLHACPLLGGEISVCETGQWTMQAECINCSHGSPPEWSIAGHSGNGNAWVSPIGSVFYDPSPLDINQDVVITVNANCPCTDLNSCQVHFYVAGNLPDIDAGNSFTHVGIDNTFTKNDIKINDPDDCIPYEYQLISGPGAVDVSTGVYTWVPTIGDVGHNEITVAAVYQEQAIVSDMFELDVFDQVENPGDANCDGGMNIGDAVYLLNHIFNDGPVPPIANWADANADCMINIGDAVRLLNCVFGGPYCPEPGCVE